jgi:hypothetical protein
MPTALPQERALVSAAEEAGWVPGPVWTNTEKIKFLAPTGVWNRDHSDRRNSLCWLHYPSPHHFCIILGKVKIYFCLQEVVPNCRLASKYNWPTVPTKLLWTFTNILNLYGDPFSMFLVCILRSLSHLSTSTDFPDTGNHPMSCPVRTRSSFSVGKVTRTWRWPLTCI